MIWIILLMACVFHGFVIMFALNFDWKSWLRKDFWTIWDTTDKILCWLGMHDWDTKYWFNSNVGIGRFKIDHASRTCKRKHCKAKTNDEASNV